MIIPVEQELQIAESYLDIQRIKNADRIHVAYAVAPEVLESESVKFILQPFVENALEHAWYDDEISWLSVLTWKRGMWSLKWRITGWG